MLTKNDIAAVIGCYLNGCTIDEIYSIFEGEYYKTEITIVIDDFKTKTGWEGKDFNSRKKLFKAEYI